MTDAPAARMFALVFGAIYLVVGLAGFAVTGFTDWLGNGNAQLLGFDLNVFHNLIHLSVGAALLLAWRLPEGSSTQGVNLGVGVFLLAAAVAGFADSEALRIISIDSRFAADNFLHLVSGLVAAMFGFSRVKTAARQA